MPKVKTNKSISKRFRITKNGKVLRGQNFHRHLSVRKSSKHKRALSGTVLTKETFAKKIRKALGIKRPKALRKLIKRS
jgi:large subunit ribosomal protein L35